MVELLLIFGLFYGTIVNEYPGPKTKTSQDIYKEKKENNPMNVQEVDTFWIGELEK